jgi:hypothetical protein
MLTRTGFREGDSEVSHALFKFPHHCHKFPLAYSWVLLHAQLYNSGRIVAGSRVRSIYFRIQELSLLNYP